MILLLSTLVYKPKWSEEYYSIKMDNRASIVVVLVSNFTILFFFFVTTYSNFITTYFYFKIFLAMQ